MGIEVVELPPLTPAPTPPLIPTNFTAIVVIGLRNNDYYSQLYKVLGDEVGPPYFAARAYFDSNLQVKRIDATLLGGFFSTFDFYKVSLEYIYTYYNLETTPTCFQYSLDKSGLPPRPDWLIAGNATYVGEAEVKGQECQHWSGKGIHLGPNVGPLEYDVYFQSSNGSFIPVLIENIAFVQYYAAFGAGSVTHDQVMITPNACQ
eukprot:TRINITY_DN7274_c0_g1_i1.p1 TRINITY_DN7274_c0_g1~~TRINITY_DN7274_c0_g1_i1.p1  ORF type:complete len:238 (-),score=27.57 TRINITY_DN7274_c0_g1_i1:180-791(-)